MKLIATVVGAGILLAAVLALLPRIWNPVENGPDLHDPTSFVGCYGAGSNKVVLTRGSATVVGARQSTQILRFFYLKSDAAINTTNNLQYDAAGRRLRIGDAKTGFFYRFDSPTKPTALLIPDDAGNVRKLLRVPC